MRMPAVRSKIINMQWILSLVLILPLTTRHDHGWCQSWSFAAISIIHRAGTLIERKPVFRSNLKCTQLEAHDDDLQEGMLNVSLAQPSIACVQINISPGNHIRSLER